MKLDDMAASNEKSTEEEKQSPLIKKDFEFYKNLHYMRYMQYMHYMYNKTTPHEKPTEEVKQSTQDIENK